MPSVWFTGSPDDFIQAIQAALGDRADFKTAQQLSFQAVEHYPDHEEILTCAYLLAPPMVIKGNPVAEDRPFYQDWLRKNHFKYRHRWVALYQGELVAEAPKQAELAELVQGKDNLVMISIG